MQKSVNDLKQRKNADALEEAQREERYRRGYSQAIVVVRVLLAGGASDKDLRRFFKYAYKWRVKGKIHKEEAMNKTKGSPEKFVFDKDEQLLRAYQAGLKIYRE